MRKHGKLPTSNVCTNPSNFLLLENIHNLFVNKIGNMPGPTKQSEKKASEGKDVDGNVDNGSLVQDVSKGEVIAVFTPDTKRLKVVNSRETATKIVEDAKGLFECEMKLFDDVIAVREFEKALNGTTPIDKVSLL